MPATVYHLQINVGDPALAIPFWRDLLGYLEYLVAGDARPA
ncbi:MAG: hypothetical protein ACREJ9_17895 [Candidatus Rokuibacteriota bacterium]